MGLIKFDNKLFVCDFLLLPVDSAVEELISINKVANKQINILA